MREAGTVGPEERVALRLGAIVRRGDEFLVCVQPRCDAVRLTTETQFVFSALARDSAAFEVVVRDSDGRDVCLGFDESSAGIRTDHFKPDGVTKRVQTDSSAGPHMFVSTSGEEYFWLCDLRPSFAQRFAHRIANNLSRIGLAEFEWQRRQSSGV